MAETYVVCETDVAVLLHLRQGVYQACGQQDSRTLCERKPAWDTRIPVSIFDEPTVDPGTRRCRTCMEAYKTRGNKRGR